MFGRDFTRTLFCAQGSEFCLFLDWYQSFVSEARQQCALLMNMFQNMEALYSDLAEYYVFDKQKYTLNEFFTDLKMFKDDFYVSF